MNAVEIEKVDSTLAERPFDRTEFQFPEAFGNKPATMKQSRDGHRFRGDSVATYI